MSDKKEIITKKYIVTQALKTYFREEEINYIFLILEKIGLLDNLEALSKFITHVNILTYTGYFSLTFNHKFRTYVKDKDQLSIETLLNKFKNNEYKEDIYPELYKSNLSSLQKKIIKEQRQREILTTYDTIKTSYILEGEPSLETSYIYPYKYFLGNKILRKSNSLYQYCYEKVIKFEEDTMSQNIELHDENNLVLNTFLLPYKSNNGLYVVKPFTLKEILNIVNSDLIQKNNKHNFSRNTLNMICKRFNKELIMYDYFHRL